MPDDLMGDPGPAEAMVRRAVEQERERILEELAEEARHSRGAARIRIENVIRRIEKATAIRRRGE